MIDFGPYLTPQRHQRQGRTVAADEAIAAIPDRSRLFLAAAAGTPRTLVAALAEQHARFTAIEVVTAYLTYRPPLFDHLAPPFRFTALQANLAYRKVWDSGAIQIMPCRYSDSAGLFRVGGPLEAGVALITVSAPSAEGKVSLGLSVGATIDAVKAADLVIAQVNPSMPYTRGAGELRHDEVDYFVEADEPIRTVERAVTPDERTLTIATAAAAHIEDGSTIQFGVGALPDAILGRLTDRRGLKVHGGMLSEACLDLVRAGAVEPPLVAGEVEPTEAMIEWVTDNPDVQLGPAAYTHGAAVISRLPKFVAIQSAVEVGLDGAANSEIAGGRVISGPGGAPDYVFGASLATGGRSIVALNSTTSKGASRIVKDVEHVTLPDYVADLIVTEHGEASVRGQTLTQRATNITALAAPQHRAQLLA